MIMGSVQKFRRPHRFQGPRLDFGRFVVRPCSQLNQFVYNCAACDSHCMSCIEQGADKCDEDKCSVGFGVEKPSYECHREYHCIGGSREILTRKKNY